MRFILLLLAVVALLFVVGFGGLRGFEQFGAGSDLADKTGLVTTVGGTLGDIVGEDNVVADALGAFASGADGVEGQAHALQRGGVGMMALALLGLLLILFALLKARGAVLFFAFATIAAAVVTWILNPEIDLGPLQGLTQQLLEHEWARKIIDLGPMSDTSPKSLALLLGVVAAGGAFLAVGAQSLVKRDPA